MLKEINTLNLSYQRKYKIEGRICIAIFLCIFKIKTFECLVKRFNFLK